MGGRIPKSAQRAIDKANRDRIQRGQVREVEQAGLPIPRVMALGLTPRTIMNLHEVWFNGEKQTLCTLANIDKGMIRRWTIGRGNVPDQNSPQEELYGKVEIRRRGP